MLYILLYRNICAKIQSHENKHIRPNIPDAVTHGAFISELETIESRTYWDFFSLLLCGSMQALRTNVLSVCRGGSQTYRGGLFV